MKLTEIKKMRSSLGCSHFQSRNYRTVTYLYFRKFRRRCSVSIISASGHRISDGKTATRFALFVRPLSLFHSSSPLVLLRLLFFHILFRSLLSPARRYIYTRKSRFTVACHKGCFVAKAARGRQGEGGRESMRMKDERGGAARGERADRTRDENSRPNSGLSLHSYNTLLYIAARGVTARARILYWSPQGSQKIASTFFFYLIFARARHDPRNEGRSLNYFAYRLQNYYRLSIEHCVFAFIAELSILNALHLRTYIINSVRS